MKAKSVVILNSKIPLRKSSSPSETGRGLNPVSTFNFFSFKLASYSFLPKSSALLAFLFCIERSLHD
jgi:hypothetical protein